MSDGPIQLFERLAEENRAEVIGIVNKLPPIARRGLFIEVCRSLDYEQVRQVFSRSNDRPSFPEFDVLTRGWNATVASMLTPDFHQQAIPIQTSSHESRSAARSILYRMGMSSLLQKVVGMMRAGMAEATTSGHSTQVRCLNNTASDHFLDQLDSDALVQLQEKSGIRNRPMEMSTEKVQEIMADLVFPWKTQWATMVGYSGDPRLDAHYLSQITDQILDWTEEAGIHPNVDIRGTPGSLLTSVVGILASTYLKHIHFVSIGNRKIPHVNYPMSLTVWEPLGDLVKSLAEFTGEDERSIGEALKMLIVTPSETGYFQTSERPYFPMLIRVSDLYVLKPVTSIFHNPLHGARMHLEFSAPELKPIFLIDREAWMRDELNSLFLGTNCAMMSRPVELKWRNEKLTDIDAAIFDTSDGCLALFQLKWQDFGPSDIRRQTSRAKNFVEQVDRWTAKIESWIEENGLDGLAQAFQLKNSVRSVRLFAMGKFAARFQSYGFSLSSANIVVCTWPQLVRLRYNLGIENNILQGLHLAVRSDCSHPANIKPIPYEITLGEHQFQFENLWNGYPDEHET